MQILLTNDDGILAPGLWALYHALAQLHEVCVVAPDRERSAVGHGITLHQPIRSHVTRTHAGQTGIAIDGTPADCVKLGLAELLETTPDLVVSGINPGANVGINVSYSGTVAAAKEAAMAGIPAMAVSITAPGDRHMEEAARAAASLCSQMAKWKVPAGTFLNVNFPDLAMDKVRGVRWSRQGANGSVQHFEKRRDPRNRIYYWQGGDSQGDYDRPDIDGAVLAGNYISITPIKCDMTDYDALRELSKQDISIGSSFC